MKVEQSLRDIMQWCKQTINLDRHQRKSRKKEERLREKKKSKNQVLRQTRLAMS